MEAQEVKLPHHFSPIYKKMALDGLIVDKKYVGEVPLGEYLKSQEGSETSNPDLLEPEIHPEKKEDTIPVSQVAEMIKQQVAEALKGFQTQTPVPTIQTQESPRFREDINVDDIPELRNWEMKDRVYELCDGSKPLSHSISSEHTNLIPLQYTNKETQSVHIIRYATNQPSFFIEKQSKEPGSVVKAEIIFNFGRLSVPANNIVLQKLLAIHPHNQTNDGTVFREYDPLAISRKVISDKKLKLKAGNLVFSVGEIINRAIASLEFPNYVDSWDKEILEEEISAFAEKSPQKYIDYTEDSTIKMKGVIKASLANGELIYSNYRFLNKKRETLLEISKNQNEMDEMVLFFESGVGRTTYEYLLNRM